MAKKVDWIKQVKGFLKSMVDTVAERKNFCEHKGLPYNTFRTHLSKYKKSDAFKNSQAQQSAGREIKKQSTKEEVEKKSKVEVAGRRARITVTKKDSNPDIERLPGGLRRFRPGNTASLVHGKHAKKAFLSDEYAELSQSPLVDQLGLLKQHFHFMNNLGVKNIRNVEDRYANNQPITKTSVNGKGEVVSVELTIEQVLNELSLGVLTPLAEALKIIAIVEKGLTETEIKLHAVPALSKADQQEVLSELVLMRTEENWSASQLVAHLVSHRVDIPPWLLKDLENELRNAEDEVDDTGGLTPEAAEVLREKSIARRAGRQERSNEIKKRNDNIYAGAAGLGSEKLTNSKEVGIEEAVIVEGGVN